MKQRYDLVVFDWEGTLAEDSYGVVVNTILNESKRMQIDGFDKFIARRYLSMGLPCALNKLFPNISIYQHEYLLESVQEKMVGNAGKVCLTQGALNVIQKINSAGIMLGIATNKSLSSLNKVLESTKIGGYFQSIRTATQTQAKPCPQMLEEIILECAVTNSKTLMVGDAISDIEMAQSIDVDAIGVDFYHEQQGNFLAASAIFELDDYQQLLDYLKI